LRTNVLGWERQLRGKTQLRVRIAYFQERSQQLIVAVGRFNEQLRAGLAARTRLKFAYACGSPRSIHRQIPMNAEALTIQAGSC
jgi:hypothetical protein